MDDKADKGSAVLVMSVDVEVPGSGPCVEPRDAFLDLKKFLEMRLRFISVDDRLKVEDKDLSIT